MQLNTNKNERMYLWSNKNDSFMGFRRISEQMLNSMLRKNFAQHMCSLRGSMMKIKNKVEKSHRWQSIDYLLYFHAIKRNILYFLVFLIGNMLKSQYIYEQIWMTIISKSIQYLADIQSN